MNIRAKSEPVVEDWWQETIDKFTDQKHIFNMDFIIEFKQFMFRNKGLEWQFLDCIVIILIAFFVM